MRSMSLSPCFHSFSLRHCKRLLRPQEVWGVVRWSQLVVIRSRTIQIIKLAATGRTRLNFGKLCWAWPEVEVVNESSMILSLYCAGVLILGTWWYISRCWRRYVDSNIISWHFWPIPATDTECAEAKQCPYPQIVGSILYAITISRPDLSHSASVLSRFISKWNKTHYQAAKQLLRYIRGATDLSLVFNGDCVKQIIQGYADADWGEDLDTKRSATGYIFMVCAGTIAWKSCRQPTVALSTTEAEYMASADATWQAQWLRLLLDNLQIWFASRHSNPNPQQQQRVHCTVKEPGTPHPSSILLCSITLSGKRK